ncbi:integrase [Psychromonas sp. MB-3u-54]|uniref:integrase domain-containing protein n=1 Tax=Psychromonas sp. MB-3u-54 TaxID=2058319 RepID=UPI000C347EF0|nr:integrase domain-containing protein [Psychromonas sp. MB-3u-54]PKH04012.1 integrase [Psychromonas sp. MB-3u-54]
MARITNPLTNTEVKQAKAKEKEYSLADGDGLMLRVKPNGSKLWLFNYYRPFSKKRANISFGQYPEVTLAEARKKRAEARALISKDIDPKTHKEELNHQKKEALENTFGVLAEKWIELKKQQVTPKTADEAYQALNRHILPSLQKVPIQLIKPKMVIDIIQPVVNKGSLETAKRLCRFINEIMRLAVASGIIEINYLADITKLFPSPKRSHMATIEPKRLPELMNTLCNASITRTTRCLVEWQLHTMTRPIESATARWQDIDLDKKVWVIPAERMKMKKPHTIPLTPQTLALLNVIHSMSGHLEYLFPSFRNPKNHANSQSANMALKRMGFAGELVSHGLRALASTTLNEQGFDPDVIEAALAHIDKNEVRRAYNRAEYIERRRVLMCWWSNHIEESATGKMDISNSFKSLKVVNL